MDDEGRASEPHDFINLTRPKIHIDASRPEAGELWRQGLDDNNLIHPKYVDITEPPDTPDQFLKWLKSTVNQAWIGKNASGDQTSKNEVQPLTEAFILLRYGEALNNWHEAEREGNDQKALVSLGEASGLMYVITHFNLDRDREYIEHVFGSMPTVDNLKFKRRVDNYLNDQQSS